MQKTTATPRQAPHLNLIRRRMVFPGSGSSAPNPQDDHDANSDRNKRVPRPTDDPIIPGVLLICKQIHQEALPILYRDNTFNLYLEFSLLALVSLRQRTRSLIKSVIITINEHNEVLNGGFNDIFTNGLRYCFGLQKLEIVTKVPMPRDRSYDLNFHILRWLPKACKVEVKGERVSEGVRKMVDEQNMLAEKLDLVSIPPQCPYHAYCQALQRVKEHSDKDTNSSCLSQHTYHRRQIQTYYMERGQQVDYFVDGVAPDGRR